MAAMSEPTADLLPRLLAWIVVVGAIAGAAYVSLRPGWSGGERFALVTLGATVGAIALMVPWLAVRWRSGGGDGAP